MDYALVVLGALISAVGYNAFVLPNDLIVGGVAGIAIIINRTLGAPVGALLFALNVPLLALGWKFGGGRRFLTRTLLGVVTLSLAIDLLGPWVPHPTADRLLVIFYGGIIEGIGLAVVFRGRGTQGGIDIIGRILKLKFGVAPGQAMLGLNMLVFAGAAVMFGLEAAMIALMLSFVSARTLDTALYGFSATRSLLVISDRNEALLKELNALERYGVTVLKGHGGFTKEPRDTLYMTVARSEVLRLQRLILRIDPEAYIAVYQVHETRGGFALPAEEG